MYVDLSPCPCSMHLLFSSCILPSRCLELLPLPNKLSDLEVTPFFEVTVTMMAATRSVVSYDDITLPYDQPDERQSQASSLSHNAHYHHPPPSKKRKKNNQKAKQHRSASNSTSQRAEFLKSTGASSKQPPEEEQWDADAGEGEYGYDEEGGEGEESRELTHEEIWDDSALVNAWEAATEEYEAYHGPDKGWKKEPVNKSPL
jgi:hypothetical protein